MADLQYWPTPLWFAEQLVERHFPDLGARDLVLDAGCGAGEFLAAVPANVPTVGVEIDPVRAAIARETGRPVIDGDFATVEIPWEPTLVLGNPPFKSAVVQRFLARSHELLPPEGRIGWILSGSLFQHSSTVVAYQDRWSIEVELIPRNVFGRLRLPLVFAKFTKNHERRLVGLALYAEHEDWRALDRQFREILASGRRPIWRSLVEAALVHLGGRAPLADIYRAIAPRRPTGNQFWREKIRQVCGQHFRRVADGVFALEEADA